MITFISIMIMVALCVFICIGIAKMWHNTDLEMFMAFDLSDDLFGRKVRRLIIKIRRRKK